MTLFTLLKYKEHFNAASQLLEEIMPERAHVFDLSLVPDFTELVGRLDLNKLAVFCRVLALVVFDSGEVSKCLPQRCAIPIVSSKCSGGGFCEDLCGFVLNLRAVEYFSALLPFAVYGAGLGGLVACTMLVGYILLVNSEWVSQWCSFFLFGQPMTVWGGGGKGGVTLIWCFIHAGGVGGRDRDSVEAWDAKVAARPQGGGHEQRHHQEVWLPWWRCQGSAI